MKQNINTYFSEKKEYIIKLILFILFCFIVIISTRSRDTIKKEINNLKDKIPEEEIEVTEEELEQEDYFINLVNKLNNNNYDLNIIIHKDKENKIIGFSRESANKEVIYLKTDDKKEYYYYKNDNLFYKNDEDKLVKSDVINVYNYEIDIFDNIDNLIKLLDKSERRTLTVNDNDAYYRYKIKLSDLIEIYNDLNVNSNIISEEEDVIVMDIYFYNNIKKIVIDYTSFYNLLYHTNYKNVEYEYKFMNVNKVNLKEIDNLIK